MFRATGRGRSMNFGAKGAILRGIYFQRSGGSTASWKSHFSLLYFHATLKNAKNPEAKVKEFTMRLL
jgi:hypothetical protein